MMRLGVDDGLMDPIPITTPAFELSNRSIYLAWFQVLKVLILKFFFIGMQSDECWTVKSCLSSFLVSAICFISSCEFLIQMQFY